MRTATVYNFLLEANLMASIAILLMLVVRKCFRRPLGNRVIYFAWLLIAIRLLCPLALPNPAINTITSQSIWDGAIRPIAGQLKVRFAEASEALYHSAMARSGDSHNVMLDAINSVVNATRNGLLARRLMQVYLVGAASVLGWFVLSNLRFRHKLRADRIEPISGKLLEQFSELCKQRGVKPIPVCFVDPLPSACLVGVFQPYIALPLTAKPQEAIQVLAHEVSHVRGRDHLWAILRLLCCIVHWFNPLVWLAASMSRVDCELACDDRVVERLNADEKRAYANVLVLAAAKRSVPGVGVLATGMTMTGRRLKTRVNAILRSRQVRKGFALCFVLLACMSLVGAFGTEVYRVLPQAPVYAEEQPLPQVNIASKEEAIDYAELIWHSPYLGEDTAGAEWKVTHLADDCYEVVASKPDWMGTLTVRFLPSGRITHLYNRNSCYNRSNSALGVYSTNAPEEWERFHAYALRFLQSVDPVTAGSFTRIRGMGEAVYGNGDARFYDLSAASGENEYAAMLSVELTPVIRIVRYDLEDKDLWWPELKEAENEEQHAASAAQSRMRIQKSKGDLA